VSLANTVLDEALCCVQLIFNQSRTTAQRLDLEQDIKLTTNVIIF